MRAHELNFSAKTGGWALGFGGCGGGRGHGPLCPSPGYGPAKRLWPSKIYFLDISNR